MFKVKKNQIWRDNKASGNRFIRVLETPSFERVRVCTFYSGEKGVLPTEVKNALEVTCRENRFNNKSSGYTLVANSMKEFLDNKIHLKCCTAEDPVDEEIEYVPSMAVGEIWRELEPRYSRYVEILGQDESGERNKIVTCYFTEVSGSKVEVAVGAKPTYAKRERFNGKRKGYEFVAKDLDAFISDGSELQKIYVGQDHPAEEEVLVEEFLLPVSVRQLWQDSNSTLLRLVEVTNVNGNKVCVENRYIQESEGLKPRRVTMEVAEVVSLSSFADGGRFVFVTAL